MCKKKTVVNELICRFYLHKPNKTKRKTTTTTIVMGKPKRERKEKTNLSLLYCLLSRVHHITIAYENVCCVYYYYHLQISLDFIDCIYAFIHAHVCYTQNQIDHLSIDFSKFFIFSFFCVPFLLFTIVIYNIFHSLLLFIQTFRYGLLLVVVVVVVFFLFLSEQMKTKNKKTIRFKEFLVQNSFIWIKTAYTQCRWVWIWNQGDFSFKF